MERLIPSPLPIIAAPMAGGPSGPRLAAAVAEAGAFPFLAAGYATVEKLAQDIDELRALGVVFGVNLFVVDDPAPDRSAFASYVAEIGPDARELGIDLDPEPRVDDDLLPEKLAHLVAHPVPVVSLTFGLPGRKAIAELQAVGTTVLATVTTPEEAGRAQEVGVDGLIVQGASAGGHSGTHDPNREPAEVDTADLVTRVREAVDLPVIAAGGVDGPEAVRRLLDAGAEAVVVGTLLLRTDEAGTSPTHRAALADPAFTETVITRSFTGRPARALRNGFIDRHERQAITAYPAVHHLTRTLRQRAGASGDADRLHLWAGAGWRSAPEGPAGDVIRRLASGL